MGADNVLLFYGVRIDLGDDADQVDDPPDEILALEKRARKQRLDLWTGCLTDGANYHLFVGKNLGCFGVEGKEYISFSSQDLSVMFSETEERLRQADIEGVPLLHSQLEAQY